MLFMMQKTVFLIKMYNLVSLIFKSPGTDYTFSDLNVATNDKILPVIEHSLS